MNSAETPATPAEWYVESWDGTSAYEDYRSFQTASEASVYAHRVFYGHPEAYAYVYACDSEGRYTGVTYAYRH